MQVGVEIEKVRVANDQLVGRIVQQEALRQAFHDGRAGARLHLGGGGLRLLDAGRIQGDAGPQNRAVAQPLGPGDGVRVLDPPLRRDDRRFHVPGGEGLGGGKQALLERCLVFLAEGAEQDIGVLDDFRGRDAEELAGAFADVGVADVALRVDDALIDDAGNGRGERGEPVGLRHGRRAGRACGEARRQQRRGMLTQQAAIPGDELGVLEVQRDGTQPVARGCQQGLRTACQPASRARSGIVARILAEVGHANALAAGESRGSGGGVAVLVEVGSQSIKRVVRQLGRALLRQRYDNRSFGEGLLQDFQRAPDKRIWRGRVECDLKDRLLQLSSVHAPVVATTGRAGHAAPGGGLAGAARSLFRP